MFVKRPARLKKQKTMEEKVVQLSPINGNYCTILEKGSLSPLTPCESPLLLKSVQNESEGPYFQFKIRRRNCIRERDPATSSRKDEGEREKARRKDRAAIIRKSTLEQIKKQNEELATAAKPMLFDTALIIAIERGGDGSARQHPQINFVFGQHPKDEKCSYILYPDASHAMPLRRGTTTLDPSDHSFFVALTDENGLRTYAYCIKFEPAASEIEPFFYPCVFALITRIRDPAFYFELARRAIQHIGEASILKNFLSVVRDQPHPRRGGMLVINQKNERGDYCKRSEICTFGCEPRMKMGWSVNDLVRKLTPEWTACIIAAVLAEQRVLITGSSVHEVTRAAQAIDALLRPFEWPFCFIPCIPDNIVEFCENPSPYLIGILRCNLEKVKDLVVEDSLGKDDWQKKQTDFALFDIDRGLINPIPLSFKNNKHFEEHDSHFRHLDEKERETHLRLKNCYTYCKRVGMPRKVTKNLVQLLERGLEKSKSEFDIETCTESMLTWYATLFGHYKSSGATTKWDRDTKMMLIEKQSQPSRRDYLEYLVESAMFNMWIERRVTGYNVAKILGDTTRDMVQFMQNVLMCLEITTISDPAPGFPRFSQHKAGDRLVNPAEELEMIDAIFEQISDVQNYKRKKPVKHAFGKIFGSSRRN
ncbi:hypothetical protein PMAYCL1PPCAC_30898 [Pristionchus mayeri]|uniref:UDENN domain-containing protein n=1 Tax=Pristionchus mayeri TaxID=1317129 RepID=A0AAN5IC42_9BILA|nr:hypothetical protein PMAYCL1PPCAC_30898 [Pristionchus mayeri]